MAAPCRLITDRDLRGRVDPDMAAVRAALAALRDGSVTLERSRRTFLRIHRNRGGLCTCEHGRGEHGVFSLYNTAEIVTEPDGFESLVEAWLGGVPGDQPLTAELIAPYTSRPMPGGEWVAFQLRPGLASSPPGERPASGYEHSYDFRGECFTYRDPDCYVSLTAFLPSFLLVEWLREDWRDWDNQPLDDEHLYRRSVGNILAILLDRCSTVLLLVPDRECGDPWLIDEVARRSGEGQRIALLDVWDDADSVANELHARLREQRKARQPVGELDDDRPHPHVTDGETLCRDVTLQSLRKYLREAREADDGFVITARTPLAFFQAAWNPEEGWYCECCEGEGMVVCAERFPQDEPVARAMRDFVCGGTAWSGGYQWDPHPDFTPRPADPAPPAAAEPLRGRALLAQLHQVFQRHRHQDVRLLGIEGALMLFGFPRWGWILLWVALGFPGIAGSWWALFGMEGETIGLQVFAMVVFLPYGAFALWMLTLRPVRFFIDTNQRIAGCVSPRGKLMIGVPLDDCFVSCERVVYRGDQFTTVLFPVTTWCVRLRGPAKPTQASPSQSAGEPLQLSWPLIVGYRDPQAALAEARLFAEALGVRELVDLTA